MRFGKHVVEFAYHSVPLVGNLENGYVIGLTQEGFDVCHRMFDSDVSEEEISAVDKNLLFHLEHAGFFEGESSGHQLSTVYLHATQNCNLNCAGCYSLDEKRNNGEDAPVDKIKEVLDQLSSLGVKRLIISGGEPFLREDLPLIIEQAKKLNRSWHIDVLTNGTLVTPEKLEQIAPFVDRVCVSFDGWSENTIPHIRKEQRFTELVKAIGMIREAGITPHILPTLHAKNIKDIKEYFELAKQLDVKINFSLFSASADDEVGSLIPTEQDLVLISDTLEHASTEEKAAFLELPLATTLAVRLYCGAGRGIFSIASDGKVYPCHMLHFEQLSMGSVFEESLEDILLSRIRKEITSLSTEKIDSCLSCEVRYFCGGGCRARAYYAFGSIHEKDPYCSLMKSYYSAYMKRVISEKK